VRILAALSLTSVWREACQTNFQVARFVLLRS
jgi:hypothetical protein